MSTLGPPFGGALNLHGERDETGVLLMSAEQTVNIEESCSP